MPTRQPSEPGCRRASGRLPPGRRVYAIGDVHGCARRLRALHAAIAADLAAAPVGDATLVHLGDYIDRGPDSAGVIAMLADPPPIPGIGRRIALTGNHERMMLDAMAPGANEQTVAHWLHNGGDRALGSWGIDARSKPGFWRDAVPPEHLAFLEGLALMWRLDDYLFVHAGIRPGVPLEKQSAHDLLWIRHEFLDHDGDLGVVVVHGHTPAPSPEVLGNRINLDTGAVRGGALTCGVLEGDTIRFLTA